MRCLFLNTHLRHRGTRIFPTGKQDSPKEIEHHPEVRDARKQQDPRSYRPARGVGHAWWNYQTFGILADTYKQINPNGIVIFGGTHVANQASRVMSMFPEVDIIVNGEGEKIFRDIFSNYLDGRSKHHRNHINGISYIDENGQVITTEERARIDDLDLAPSPILTGAVDLTDDDGKFLYDVALMETNRGCPYRYSFCYWGGAVGQRVRAFSRNRLRVELATLAQLKVETIALCDTNFGLLPIDEEFVDDLIELREKYGYPYTLESSWTKNKSKPTNRACP